MSSSPMPMQPGLRGTRCWECFALCAMWSSALARLFNLLPHSGHDLSVVARLNGFWHPWRLTHGIFQKQICRGCDKRGSLTTEHMVVRRMTQTRGVTLQRKLFLLPPFFTQHCPVAQNLAMRVQIDSAGAEEEAQAPTPHALAPTLFWKETQTLHPKGP